MRTWQPGRLSMVAFALLATIAIGVPAAESESTCPDAAFRFGGGVIGFPISSGDVKLEAAVGLGSVSLSVWSEMTALPSFEQVCGGEIKLAKDWLALSLIASPGDSQTELSLRGQAAPPAWLLYTGVPTLIGGISGLATTSLLEDAGRSEITLSPFLTGVVYAGEAVVSPTVGLDLSFNSEDQVLEVSGTSLASSVTVGTVLIANTVHFTGPFDAFSSLVVSVTLPDYGLTVSGSLTPSAFTDGFSYRVGVSYEWGNTSLLPALSGKTGSTCTGDVCF